uniref:Reelin domain-containing protein n=1 Tax=Magallana gigas TaxID=29159 RepID=A0A8W8JA15_MAGGI|nr:uncharacterized protein LOC117691167 [Crassostrea gigas]
MSGKLFPFALLLLVDVSLAGALATEPVCPTVGLPADGARQSNVLHGTKPMFVLDSRAVRGGYLPGESYSLFVKAQDRDRKFSDVLVWAEGSGLQGCSAGSFDSNPDLYHQPDNCPHLVTRNSKVPEHLFQVTWTAPPCGCVTIRARATVAETGSFVLDDSSIKDGYLTSYICPQDLGPLLTAVPTGEREDLLCRVVDNVTGSDVAIRRHVLSRRKMEYNAMSLLQKESWENALHQRAYNIKMCCGLRGTERSECFGDERRHRIDRFCAYGETIIPYTVKRRGFMEQRREECCWKLGERRYHCFAHIPTDKAFSSDSLWNVEHVQEMDESDPLNDLEDYNHEVLKELSNYPALMKAHADNAISDENREKIAQKQKSSLLKEIVTKATFAKLTTAPVVMTTEAPTTITTVSMTTTDVEVSRKTTLTSDELQRKMRKIKLRMDCCESGREAGEGAEDDPWGICVNLSHKFSRKIRKGRRKCRTYFMKCCIEEAESEETIDVDDDEEEEEDVDDEDKEPKELSSDRDNDDRDENDDVSDDNEETKTKLSQRKPVRRNGRRNRKRGQRNRRRG